MAAADTEKKLRTRIAGGTLQLSGASADSAELSLLLPGAFGTDTLALAEPAIAVDGETLTITGFAQVLGVERAQLTLAIDYAGPRLTLSLATLAPTALSPEVSVALEALTFFKAHDGPWGASGALRVRLLDVDLTLQAFYEQDGATLRVRLRQQLNSPPATLALAPIGSLALAAVELRRSATGDAVRWQYAADGALALAAVPALHLALYGTVTFPPDGADAGIDFVASDDARNRIVQQFPVAGATPAPAVVFTPHGGRLTRSGAPPDTHWALRMAAGTEFTGMPGFLTEPIPGTAGLVSILPATPREWTLAVEPGRVALTIDRLQDAPARAVLPDLPRSGADDLPLGTLWIDATDWGVVFGGAPALAVTVHVAASEELNRLFGTRADGLTPTLQFFRTYAAGEDPAAKATGLHLEIGKDGVLARLLGSPLEWLQFDDPWWLLTLGNAAAGEHYGKVRFQPPTFRYDGRRMSASGAWEVIEPLRLPLQPVKSLLRAAGLAALAEALPEALPIEPVRLATPDGRLDAAGFLALVARAGADAALMRALEEAVAAIDGVLARTPGAFARFLAVALPQRLDYDIAIAPGGVQLDIRTGPDADPGREPIRALLPFVDPVFGPELMGVELYGVSFGGMLGGALGVLRLDARLERFDLATLALCQLSGGRDLDGEPVGGVHRRYVFDHLLALLPAAAPVPVPLFYRELGIAYQGWDGLQFVTCWSFPEPELGFLEAIDLIRAAYRFAAEPAFLFDPDAPAPGGLDLPLRIGPNFIRLPSWLGGALLGDDQGAQGRLWSSIANALDGLKTGQVHYFLDAVPLPLRVGAQSARFGPFALDGAYALTTPREFGGAQGTAVRALLATHLQRDPDTRLLDVLPAGGTDAGLVMLLASGFEVAGFLKLEGGFVFAANGAGAQDAAGRPMPRGVATALRFEGAVGPLGMRIEGALGAGSAGVWVALASSPILWNGEPLLRLRGHLAIGAGGFTLGAGFSLSMQCEVDGELFIGTEQLSLGGTLAWRYAAGQTLTGQARVAFATAGITATCEGALYGVAVTLGAILDGAGSRALVTVHLPEGLQQSFLDDVAGIAGAAQQAIDAAQADLAAKAQGYELELSLRGLRGALPGVCASIVRAIDDGIASAFARWPRRRVSLGFTSFTVEVPGKSAALSSARSQAQPYKNALNALAGASDARKSDGEAFRAALDAALAEVLARQHLTIKVSVLGTIVNRDLYDNEFRARLVAAREAVARLPETSEQRASAEALVGETQAALAPTAALAGDIASGVSERIPVVESVSFTAPLATLASAIDPVEVRVRHHGSTRVVPVALDFEDLPGTVQRIARAFAG